MNNIKQSVFIRLISFLILFGNVFQVESQTALDSRVTLSGNYGLVSLFIAPNFNTNYEYSNAYGLDTIVSYRFVEMETVYKIKPINLRAEFPLNERSTLGFQAFYNGFTATGIITDSLWNPSVSAYQTERFSTNYKMHRVRIQAVFTRYFQLQNPRWNMFFSSALGANIRVRDYLVNGERGDFKDSGIFDFPVFPISMRFACGLRYKIHEKLGLQSEFGIGGPLISVGLTSHF